MARWGGGANSEFLYPPPPPRYNVAVLLRYFVAMYITPFTTVLINVFAIGIKIGQMAL